MTRLLRRKTAPLQRWTFAKAFAFVGFAGCLSLTAVSLPTSVEAAEARSYLLSTASTGGTYYPVGVAISTLTKVKLEPKQKISLNAVSSAGSGENVKLLRENEAQFAILQGLYGAYAWNGTGPIKADGKQDHLRSVSMLWQNVEHFVMNKADAKTGMAEDFLSLKGKKLSLGSRNSGTLGSNTQILKGFGVADPAAYFDLAYMGYGASADAYQNGQIQAMSIPAGVPVSAITRAFAAMEGKLTILGFNEDQIKKANGDFKNLWTPYEIAARTYPGQVDAVTTIAQPNFLATRADVDEDAVYQITKTMYENLAFLQHIHKATKAMSLEKAITGLPMPLHPGALRYYEEAGVTVPDHLKP